MLLEIKVLGLRYLSPVVVSEVRDRPGARETSWGFRYDTLAGHLESGSEWFLLSKDHDSGEIRFRIEATWRPGQFPNGWSRLGFRLLAPRYQRAWHRLAYLRLRARLSARGLPPLPAGRRLLEAGTPLPAPPIEALAGAQSPVGIAIEEVIVLKEEDVMGSRTIAEGNRALGGGGAGRGWPGCARWCRWRWSAGGWPPRGERDRRARWRRSPGRRWPGR